MLLLLWAGFDRAVWSSDFTSAVKVFLLPSDIGLTLLGCRQKGVLLSYLLFHCGWSIAMPPGGNFPKGTVVTL
jgi:hypothetical protein